MTWAKLLNSNANKENLNEVDFEIVEHPDRLVTDEGIQYPTAAIYRFTDQENVDLFGLYKKTIDVTFSEIDEEIEEDYVEKYYINDATLIEQISKRSKDQAEVDRVLQERAEKEDFDRRYGYRAARKTAYIGLISPEHDAISTLGDVVDALYQAVWKGDTTKLEEVSLIIESVKEQNPKPSANTA